MLRARYKNQTNKYINNIKAHEHPRDLVQLRFFGTVIYHENKIILM